MSFWPNDINADEVLSPRDIMADAGKELENRTGKLTVSIRGSQLEDRIVLAFEVMHRESRMTLNLFEASHRIEQSYPVLIDPPEQDVPEFLKKQRYVSQAVSLISAMEESMRGTREEYVENPWVCATPAEFRQKLTELFTQDYVKSRVISLLTPVSAE